MRCFVFDRHTANGYICHKNDKPMSGIKDTATVTLNVNGAQAKQMMGELETKIKATRSAIEQMKASAADPKDIEKARKQLKNYEKQLGDMQSAVQGVNTALTSLDTASTAQISRAIKTLQKQLKDLPAGSQIWKEHAEKIKVLKTRLNELNDAMKPQETMWDKLSKKFLQVWPIFDLIAKGYDMVAGKMREFVDAFAAMDQEMANVRKFTGMTADQVAAMNEEFKKIDTRTSREDLNRLAQEAGRLGKQSAEDVLGFVRAADQINVALDDLGDGATLTLSKLTGIFGDEQRYGTEQSLLKVGSVINELSQNCSASAPYLAEFAQRMGGVGVQADMTIPQIMGFAAVLDSNAQAVEASSTALQQVIVRMMQEPAKYAKVAGLDVQQFADMLKRDVNGALIMFLDTLGKAGGMDVLSPMFKDMGENGSRAVAALSTLASNIDMVKQQQLAANRAFEEGTSVSKEFAVQNNTVQASLDKAKKSLNDARVELGERLAPLTQYFLTSTSAVTRALMTLIRFIDENKATLISLAAGIVGYTVAVKAATIATAAWTVVEKTHTALLATQRAVYLALSGVMNLLSGNITRATAAFRAFNMAIKANPIGLAVAAITTAIAAITQWTEKTKAAREEERRLAEERRQQVEEYRREANDISKTAADYAEKELSRLRSLYAATQDQTLSQRERINAVKELQRTYPDTFGNLSREEILAGKAADAYTRLAQSIREKARAEAAKDKIKANESKLLELEMEEEDLSEAITTDTKKLDRKKRVYAGTAKAASDRNKNRLYTDGRWKKVLNEQKDEISGLETGLSDKNSRLDLNRMQQGELLAANERLSAMAAKSVAKVEGEKPVTPTPMGSDGGGGGNDKKPTAKGKVEDKFAAEKAARERAETEARIAYATGEASYLDYLDAKNTATTDYYSALLDRTDLSESERLKIEAEGYEALQKMQEQFTDTSQEQEQSRFDKQMAVTRQYYIDGQISKETYDRRIEELEIEHQRNIVRLCEDGSKEQISAQKQLDDMLIRQMEKRRSETEANERKIASLKSEYFGNNPAEATEAYNKDMQLLQSVYQRELIAAGNNADEKLRIEEAFQQAKLALQKKYGLEAEQDTRNSMQRAVDSSIEWLNSEGGKAFTGAVSTLTSGMGSIFSSLSSLVQAELELETAAIEKRYEKEIANAQGNSYKTKKIEEKKQKELAKAKNEANRKMFAMQVIQAVAQTATNAIAAYGSAAAVPAIGYILAPIAASMAIAAGMIQIAAIKKQQQASEAQGYASGGFTPRGPKYQEVGVVHAGEWVASQELLASPVARPMIEALDYAQRTNTIGSLGSADVSRSITAPAQMSLIAERGAADDSAFVAMSRYYKAIERLNERLDEPFVTVATVTGDKGIKKAQDDYDRMMSNKSKRKR